MSEQEIHQTLDDYNELANAVKIIKDKINGGSFVFREDSAGW